MTPHLTPIQLSERLRITPGALAAWRVKGRGPMFLKVGRRVLYPVPAVEVWEKANTFNNTAAAREVS